MVLYRCSSGGGSGGNTYKTGTVSVTASQSVSINTGLTTVKAVDLIVQNASNDSLWTETIWNSELGSTKAKRSYYGSSSVSGGANQDFPNASTTATTNTINLINITNGVISAVMPSGLSRFGSELTWIAY